MTFKRFVLNLTVYNPVLVWVVNRINRIRYRSVDLAVILWPPVQCMFDELEAAVSDKYPTVRIDEFSVADERFAEFVDMVYAVDPSRAPKAEMKHQHLIMPDLRIRLLRTTLPNPTMETGNIFNAIPRCAEAKAMKVDIRETFKSRIPNYIYDVIIHSTDNDEQTELLFDRIQSFAVAGGQQHD